MTLTQYLDLITSEYRKKQIFIDTVTANLAVPIRVQELLASMLPIFDVDTAAGDQEDIVGKWVGISRNVLIPIDNVYFEWDGADDSTGWDYGIWQGNLTPVSVTVLPDDVYRTLIKAKIAANRWDGTIEGAYTILDELFTGLLILIQDNMDMTYSMIFIGTVDSLTLALITGGYIPLKPEGVRVSNYFFGPTDSEPFFAWDVDSDLLAGWDEGSWLTEVPPT